jgi:hypothetical protein
VRAVLEAARANEISEQQALEGLVGTDAGKGKGKRKRNVEDFEWDSSSETIHDPTLALDAELVGEIEAADAGLGAERAARAGVLAAAALKTRFLLSWRGERGDAALGNETATIRSILNQVRPTQPCWRGRE